MNDEIKEISDYLKDDTNYDVGWGDYEKSLYKCDIEKLLDSITNLQQKYEEADYDRHKLFEENERLKELIFRQHEEYEKLFNHLIIDKPRERIKKAIEYIQNNMQYDDNIDDNWVMTNDLLNILQNGSDSQ
jgi:predicted nuclease with TOPRIM domain